MKHRVLALAIALHAQGAAAVDAVVEQPRPFGRLLGDVFSQRVLLEAAGRAFEPVALPRPERVGVWVERQATHIEVAPDGRRWLAVQYQLVNSPQELKTFGLPAWELKDLGGGVLQIPAWPMSAAPLTPRAAFGQGALDELRPDHAAPMIPTAALERRFALGAGAFLLALLAWPGWWLWRNARAAAQQPFARAQRELRRTGEESPAAWQVLHRAFDRSAGCAIQGSTLAKLFERVPQLAPLRADIERFYAQSGELFFGAGLRDRPLSLRTLCRELRRIERARER